MFKYLLSILCGLTGHALLAQNPVSISPFSFEMDDTITVTFDAQLGNGGLAGYNGDVYMYSGVITTSSSNISDWKYVIPSGWGDFPDSTRMTNTAPDIYEKTYVLADYHQIPANEQVIGLVFLFRNFGGSLSGRDVNNSDIFYPLPGYQFSPDAYVSHYTSGQELIIQADSGFVRIRPFTEDIVQVSFFADTMADDTIYSRILSPKPTAFSISDSLNYLTLNTSTLEVIISKNPLQLSFVQNGDTVLSEENGYTEQSTGQKNIRFSIGSDEVFYGSGSRAIETNLNGRRLEMYNVAHFGYSNGDPHLNICIPFVQSGKGYGLYFENHWKGYMDINSGSNNVLEYGSEGGQLSYFYVGGGSYDAVLENYTLITGRQEIPPRWALGYIQSKYGYETQLEAQLVVNDLVTNGFPLDALVLDLYWFGQPADMGNLDWNYSAFPDPVNMMSAFKSQGVKTILITEPYVTLNSNNFSYADSAGLFGTDASGSTYTLNGFWAGPSALLDITKQKTRNWMWQYYNDRILEGVDGWWCDLGEPEDHPGDMEMKGGTANAIHNVYSLMWANMLHKRYAVNYPDERLFNLIRSGYAGMQRFSTFPWSGDISRSFDGLKAQVPIMLNMGMSGVPYMHSDLGGFVGSNTPDDELYTRWLQVGAFSPIMRVHGFGIDTEPTAYSTSTQNIVKDYIRLRYRLMPYLYTLAFQNRQLGIPLVRSMNFYDPQNPLLEDINDQYLWGKDVLVAPVMDQGATFRQVVFPAGSWIDYESHVVYNGNTQATVMAPLSKLPLFIRSGSFIISVPDYSNETQYDTDTLMVEYFPDSTVINFGFFYDDNGSLRSAFQKNQYQLVSFSGTFSSDSDLEIDVVKTGGYSEAPLVRDIYFTIPFTENKPALVKQDGAVLNEHANPIGYFSTTSGWLYNSSEKTLEIHIQLTDQTTKIQLENVGTGINGVINAEDPAIHPPFPNPGSGNLFFDIEFNNSETVIFDVYSDIGQHLMQSAVNSEGFTIRRIQLPTANFPTGNYIVRARSKDSVKTFKVVHFE